MSEPTLELVEIVKLQRFYRDDGTPFDAWCVGIKWWKPTEDGPVAYGDYCALACDTKEPPPLHLIEDARNALMERNDLA